MPPCAEYSIPLTDCGPPTPRPTLETSADGEVSKNLPGSRTNVPAPTATAACPRQLNWEGWTPLANGMPDWELRRVVERLHSRYHRRIVRALEARRAQWLEGDPDGQEGAHAYRPGALVARHVNSRLRGTGLFVYAAHPSQADDAEDDWEYAGPRWYVTCMEAVLRRYKARGVAPPPPTELQEVLWPRAPDRTRPWLTEMGWTVVPEGSPPQVMHADICSKSGWYPRKQGIGRYQHFVWKLDPGYASGGQWHATRTWAYGCVATSMWRGRGVRTLEPD